MQAKKSLGQNFLNNTAVIQKMVDSLAISQSDVIVEIGPGKGALTGPLLRANPKELIVIEKDDRMVEFLKEKFTKEVSNGQLHLFHGDFLEWSPTTNNYKLIGNIPFYITGAIVRRVLDELSHPSVMTLLMQKEVAERIVMRNGKNSILGSAVNTYCKPKIIAKVKPGSFSPPPKVVSAVITCREFHNPFSDKQGQKKYFEFIHQVFSGKRKMLTTNLSTVYSKDFVSETLRRLNTSESIRAEDLQPQDLLALYSELNPQS